MTSYIQPRDDNDFVSPVKEVNIGLWSLFGGATAFLGFRLWCKITKHHGLWYDDYILLVSWMVLLANNVLISHEMATGYVSEPWDERMLLLVNITSCGTLIGQAWTKTAFAVTLMRITKQWQRIALWLCILLLNLFMILKIVFFWSRYCGKANYQNAWRLSGYCIDHDVVKRTKAAGNAWNIAMDFVLASFPWLVIWKLRISRWEKIGLCGTMSLGGVVAIVSAVRQAWMDDPTHSQHDQWYYWNQGLSMVWYSSEITGTIMVQSIPIMRPIVRDIRTSLISKRFSLSRRYSELEEGRDSIGQKGIYIERQRSVRFSNARDAKQVSEFQFDRSPSKLQKKKRPGSNSSIDSSSVSGSYPLTPTRATYWPVSGSYQVTVTGSPYENDQV